MDAARWNRVKEICLAASERSGESRAVYLDDACAGDTELRAEVDSLLGQLENGSHFLEKPIFRVSGGASVVTEEARLKRIGPYEIVSPLGHGGMGEVFLARRTQQDFRLSVAVKLVRRGMDTDEVLARFRVERQILALLHHPNIAQLLDGGATDDGRPYFVMEYIEGVPFDVYCDKNKLSVVQRLDLFLVICRAVQHAHQNLVVHRDLKPSNILVDADGTPKLLDFGIGKVLDPGSSDTGLATRTDVRVLTPQYAAPEQVRGEAVTTATDVYGLGVLLYELLAGHHPYVSGDTTREEIERAVCDTDPVRPSTALVHLDVSRNQAEFDATVIATNRATNLQHLRRRLAGDLDNIVLKALRKEPERRYQSAAALADDLQRHVAGRPVTARPDTVRYRLGKFVKRNTWQVAVAVIAFVALAATTIVTLVQSSRVADERNLALEERDKALDVRSFLLEMFGGTGADQATGDVLTVRQLLDRQSANLAGLYGDDPLRRAEMMEVLAEAYDRLGLYPEAEPLAREALQLRRDNLAAQGADVARSLNLLGWILSERGHHAEARPLLEEAVVIRRAGGERDRVVLSRSLNDLGIVVERLGDNELAENMYREALDIRLAELGDGHRSVGITANNMAVVSYKRGNLDSAVAYGELSVRSLRLALGDDHQRSVMAQMNLAAIKGRMGDYAAAEGEYRDLAERQARLQGADHPVVAMVLHNLGDALRRQDKYVEAESVFREAFAIREARVGPNHTDLASTLAGLAQALEGQGRFEEAITHQSRALSIRRQALGESDRRVGVALADLAALYVMNGDTLAAERNYRAATPILAENLGSSHSRTVQAYADLGRLLLSSGKASEAVAAYTTAHDGALLRNNQSLARQTRLRLAEAYFAAGSRNVADSLVRVILDQGGLSEADARRLDRLEQRLGGGG